MRAIILSIGILTAATEASIIRTMMLGTPVDKSQAADTLASATAKQPLRVADGVGCCKR